MHSLPLSPIPVKMLLLTQLLIACLLAAQTVTPNSIRETALISILQSNADPVEKADAAAQLRVVGTAKSVPALAALLGESTTGHAARHALEGIPAPEAGAALLKALEESLIPTNAILAQWQSRYSPHQNGLIDSLGWRSESSAVPLLTRILSEHPTLADPAVNALGRIAGTEALATLESVRDTLPIDAKESLFEALLRCAEHELRQNHHARAFAVYHSLFDSSAREGVRIAAYIGLIHSAADASVALILSGLEGDDNAAVMAALRTAEDIQDPGLTEALAALLPAVAIERQIALLALFQARADRAALPAVLSATDSTNASVRTAAASALGVLGDSHSVTPLIRMAGSADPAEQSAARQSLVHLSGNQVTEALISALESASPAEQRELVRALSTRSDPTAVSALLELAANESGSACLPALQALAQLVDSSHLKDLVKLLLNYESRVARNQLQTVFESLLQRTPNRQELDLQPILRPLGSDDAAARAAVLPVSVLFNSEPIRVAVRRALEDPDARVRESASRALCTSADPELLPDMLSLARHSPDSALRTLALDGAVRLATDENAALEKGQRVETLAHALALATRVEEKRMILSGLARVPDPATLRLAEQAAMDATVQPEAEWAWLQIAQAMPDDGATTAALERLIRRTTDPSIRTKAQAILKQLEFSWFCAGPYRIEGKQGPDLFDIAFPPELPESQDVVWRRLPVPPDSAQPGAMDLSDLVGGDHCVVYAKTRLYVPDGQKVIFKIGSDDGIKLWLNGNLVHANNAVRGLTPDQDRAAGDLHAGWNQLLAKITQHTVGCGFTIRVEGASGAEPPGLHWNPNGD